MQRREARGVLACFGGYTQGVMGGGTQKAVYRRVKYRDFPGGGPSLLAGSSGSGGGGGGVVLGCLVCP